MAMAIIRRNAFATSSVFLAVVRSQPGQIKRKIRRIFLKNYSEHYILFKFVYIIVISNRYRCDEEEDDVVSLLHHSIRLTFNFSASEKRTPSTAASNVSNRILNYSKIFNIKRALFLFCWFWNDFVLFKTGYKNEMLAYARKKRGNKRSFSSSVIQ